MKTITLTVIAVTSFTIVSIFMILGTGFTFDFNAHAQTDDDNIVSFSWGG